MSRVAIREWTSNRLSAAISAAAPTATQGPPPAARTNANIPRIASEPSRMLGSRHATGPAHRKIPEDGERAEQDARQPPRQRPVAEQLDRPRDDDLCELGMLGVGIV